MIRMKRTALIMRIAGIALLLTAILLTIWSLSFSGIMWSKMESKLTDSGVNKSVGLQFDFKADYFDTLLDVKAVTNCSTAEAREIVARNFARFTGIATEAERAKRLSMVGNYYQYFTSSDFRAAKWV